MSEDTDLFNLSPDDSSNDLTQSTIMSNSANSRESTQMYKHLGMHKKHFNVMSNNHCNLHHFPTSMNDVSQGYDDTNLELNDYKDIDKNDFCSESLTTDDAIINLESFNIELNGNEIHNNRLIARNASIYSYSTISSCSDHSKGPANYSNYKQQRNTISNVVLSQDVLFYNTIKGKVESAIYELDFRYLENLIDIDAYNPIHSAILHRNSVVIIYLIDERKCNINKVNDSNETPLMLAVKKGYEDIVEILIKQSDLYIRNFGITAFHYAVLYDRLSLVKYFIENNIYNIYFKDDNGNNIIHLACIIGNYHIVEYLLAVDYNIYKTNDENKTALLLCIIHGYDHIADLISNFLKLSDSKLDESQSTENDDINNFPSTIKKRYHENNNTVMNDYDMTPVCLSFHEETVQ